MITVYQIKLTDQDYNIANTQGFEAAPRVHAKTNLQFGAKHWKNEYAALFTPVFEVHVNDLDEAFEETNLWENPSVVTRLPGVRGHSSSVGDIFKMNDEFYMVDTFGFTKLEISGV